jgi:hypothetical protein
MEGGKLRSGLWRSADGGRSWKRVSAAIDFDGTGPTSLMGETIAFDQNHPDHAIAAGETSGIYFSTDAGETWTYQMMNGERISAVYLHRKWPNSPFLHIGTCPESALAAIGLPKPHGEAEPHLGKFIRGYWSPERFQVVQNLERPAWGVTTFAEDHMAEGPGNSPVFVGSTTGFYYTFNFATLYQLRAWDPAERLMTAFAEMPRNQGKGRSEYLFAPFALPGEPEDGRFIYKGYTGYFWNPSWLAHQNPQGVKAMSGADALRFLRDGVRDCEYVGALEAMPERPDAFVIATSQGIFKTTDNGTSYRQVWAPRR